MKSLFSNFNYRLSPSIPKLLKKILSVEGQITHSEYLLLFNFASQLSSGCILEIGSYRGRSTLVLALGSLMNHGVLVYAIELHQTSEGVLRGGFDPKDRVEFLRNILLVGLGEIMHLVNVSSEMVSKGWNKDIELLWLAGDHRYEAVKIDFDCWEPYAISGALIAFHDSRDPNLGASRVITDAISSGRFKRTYQADLTTVLEKI